MTDDGLFVHHIFSGDVTAANPVLAVGHAVREAATGKVKVGDGVTPWRDLPYVDPEDYRQEWKP